MLSPPYWIFADNFPKAGRIGKSFLVLLGCPSGRYYLGTTVCQGLLPSRCHIEKREDPGDEVELYLKRAGKTVAKMMRLQWTQDL